jgi:patatin-like phospholipase/acyl hydrolase
MLNNPEYWGHLVSRDALKRSRQMLVLHGGGIRGMVTLQILKRVHFGSFQP